MKKIAYLLIAVTIIGGAAYVLTQTSFLGGNLYESNSNFTCEELTIDAKSTVVADGKDIDLTIKVSLIEKTASLFNRSYQKANVLDISSMGIQMEGVTPTESTNPDRTPDAIETKTETNPLKNPAVEAPSDKPALITPETIKPDNTAVEAPSDEPALITPETIKPDNTAVEAPSDKPALITPETIKPDNTAVVAWKGTLIVEAVRTVDQEGAFINPRTGELTKGLAIEMSEAVALSIDITYTGGNAGDVIRAYIKEEANKCDDKIELSKENTPEEPTSTVYTCADLAINPKDTIIVKKNQDVAFDVKVKLNKPDSLQSPSIQVPAIRLDSAISTQSLLDPLGASELIVDWEGTLIIEAEQTIAGEGQFINPSALTTSNKIKLKIDNNNTKFNFIYTGGNVGDVIYAYIEDEEKDCNEKLELVSNPKAEEAVQEEVAVETDTPIIPSKEVAACTLVDIQPNTYALAADETGMSFAINVSGEPEWSGTLTLTSSNEDSIFFNDIDRTLKNNPQSIPVSGDLTNVNAKIKNVAAGDLITAYIEGEETCTDTLLLEAAVEVDIEADVEVDIEADVEEEPVVEEEIATTSDSSWETILASKDYSCTEPFDDVDESDWFWGKACRLYRASIFTGKDSDTVDGGGNLTRAEAVKVLMILSGKDGTGSGENYRDVSAGDWFYEYYVAAQEADIVRGTYANPNSPITRGDLMVYMARTAEQTLYGWDESDIPFTDLRKSDYYTYAIIIGYNTMVDDPDTGTTRVFNGYSNGTSGATNYIARSEAMTLALRFYLAWYAN